MGFTSFNNLLPIKLLARQIPSTFLIFVSRQENKVYMAKVLKKNKYCATLIGANTAQNYRFEPAILQAQKTILCSE
jgi:hypothetical protein